MRWLSGRVNSFKYAFDGLAYLFKTQTNFRIHLLITIVVIFLGFILEISLGNWCLIAFAIGFVISAEAFNTSLEVLTDIVSPGYSDKAKIVKDVAAAAVLISAVTAVLIGIIVFVPKILEVLESTSL